MVTDLGKVYGCKAFRLDGETPVLDFRRVSLNAMAGRQTQLTLDTNVVIGMVRCCEAGEAVDEQTLKREGLLAFVNFMRECNRLQLPYCISPYFALMEMPSSETESAAQAIDRFPLLFGLGWADADNSVAADLSSVGRMVNTDRYVSQRGDERKCMATYYAGLLLLLLVARDLRGLTPSDQFAAFLRLSRKHMSIVSSRLIHIARFVLAPPPSDNSEVHGLWKDIVLNFTQREKPTQSYPTSFHQMDKAAMNGAHDLLILDSLLVMEQRGLGGVDVDPWLITADRKLASLVRAVHHSGPHRMFAGALLASWYVDDPDEYWSETQRAMEQRTARLGGVVDIDQLQKEAFEIRALAQGEVGLSPDSLATLAS